MPAGNGGHHDVFGSGGRHGDAVPAGNGGHYDVFGSGGGVVAESGERVGEGIGHGVGVESELVEVEDESVGEGNDAFAAFAERFGVGRFVGDERASSAAGGDGAFVFEFAIGACDGAGGEVELPGEFSHGREAASGFEAADGDHDRQLGA